MVLGDVKRFIAILLFTTLRFYSIKTDSNEPIMDLLKDKLTSLITSMILSCNVYKIVLAICRYDTMS